MGDMLVTLDLLSFQWVNKSTYSDLHKQRGLLCVSFRPLAVLSTEAPWEGTPGAVPDPWSVCEDSW